MAELKLKPINSDSASPRLNVIFVHGLGGDPVGTWCYKGRENDGYFWPRWLAEDMKGLAVYSLGYPADKASWGSGWPIAEAAVAALERLMSNRALRASGDTPIVFVCHSLGGLIVKKLVLTADRDRGQDAQKGKFLDRIRGVVFLATPHGGSIMATIPSQLQWFVSDSMRDLNANDAALLDLSNSYRNCIADNCARIRHRVFYEKLGMFKVAKAVVPMSADPGIAGVRPVAVDRDHAAICKPLDRDDPVYEGTLAFLEEDALAPRSPTQGENIGEILRKLSEKESVPLKTLQAILASMGETAESSNAAEIEQKLTATASKFRELTDRLDRLSNADPDVARLRKEASAALAEGLFAQADQLLANAEARDLSGLEDFEALAQQKRLSAAESRAGRAVAAMLRINPDAYRQAAAHYAEASRIAAVADTLKGREYLRSQATTLAILGEEFGDNSALQEAIRLLEPMLAVSNQARDPLEWAKTQNNLGNALTALGERESGTARLAEAVAAYREALQERTRERVPLERAATQMNLGNALARLGERESGTARLEEAVAAYREALQERTRERVPLEWAATQVNLGIALARLGERESGTARLEEAVAAFRETLQESPRARAPLNWAMTQMNLGNALTALGERESGTARLEEAVAAYREALQERTRERVPLEWAKTQNNLGNALTALGERESGTARLEEAVAAYREALQENTRARVPLEWAKTTGNQGVALMLLAELRGDAKMAKLAAQQIEAAFMTSRDGGDAPSAAYYKVQLPNARALVQKLAKR